MKVSRRNLLLAAGALTTGALLPQELLAVSSARESLTPGSAPDLSLADVINLYDLEKLAKAKMSHMAFEYIDSGAADEITVRWNMEAWQKIKLMPRVLQDVSQLDTGLSILGQQLEYPILIAPSAYHRLIHPEGEIATAKGAEKSKALYVVSSNTTTSIEEIAGATTSPLWFQLYVQDDRGFTKALIEKAVANGCKAIVVTVDTPVTGSRDRQLRSGFKLPEGVVAPYLYDRGMARQGKTPEIRKPLTWKEINWLRSVSSVPVILKGILNPLDAKEAVAAGASAIIVSNHAGRNLDTVPATAEVLPAIAEAIDKRIPLLADGGIRRGTDVLKAIALGANAVLVGRPVCFGLGAGGAEGISKALNILRKEFEIAMILTGRSTIKSIDRSVLFEKA